MLTKYRIWASLHNDEPLCGLWPHYKFMGRFVAHFWYLVSIRNLVNLSYFWKKISLEKHIYLIINWSGFFVTPEISEIGPGYSITFWLNISRCIFVFIFDIFFGNLKSFHVKISILFPLLTIYLSFLLELASQVKFWHRSLCILNWHVFLTEIWTSISFSVYILYRYIPCWFVIFFVNFLLN